MNDEDVTRADCPAGCEFRNQEHVHLQHDDGCAQVWGVADGRATLLDPFDLQRTAVKLLPPRRNQRAAGAKKRGRR
jgi:hypothetical protein